MKRVICYFFSVFIGIFSLVFPISSEAIEVKLDEDTFADFQVQTRFFYLNADKGKYNFGREIKEDKDYRIFKDYRPNYFMIYKARIGAKGQICKLISFYTNIDANDNEGYKPIFWEGAIQFNFYPELVLKVGQIRTTFSRHVHVGRHNSPVMSSDGDYFIAEQFKDALKAVNPYEGGYREKQLYKRTDRGVMLAGSIKEGLIKYFAGIFNEDRGKDNRVWRNTGGFTSVTAGDQDDKKSFEYDVRIEFTPTFWGFQQEPNVSDPSSRVYQTYGGKIDTMTFGIGYHHEKHLDSADKNIYGDSSLSRDGYAVDFSFEKKLGKFIPGAEIGYMYFDDTHFYQTGPESYKKGDAWTWYGETHLIYRDKIGIGFPGIGFRYEYVDVDGKFQNKKNLVYERYGVCLSYYPKSKKDSIDVTNRIGIGFDYIKARDALKAYINSKYKDIEKNDSNFTFYIGIYAQF